MITNNKKEILLMTISFLMGGIVMILLIRFTPLVSNSNNTSSNNYQITKNGTKVYEKSSLAESVNKIYDAVLLIQGYKNDSLDSTGTGFIYKVDNKYGYVLTNEHVITDCNKIKAYSSKDEEIGVKLLGKDEYLDLAVLRIDKKYVSLIPNIGSSEKINLGDTIFTVGSPLGYEYRGSVTAGVLSGKDRLVSISTSSFSKTASNNDWVMRVLQIDASINPGNSGGPLLNVNGEVIGICSLKLVDDNIEGMGFAIPIEYAMSHVDSLEKGEKIKWPVLGIGMVNVNDATNLTKNNIKVQKNIKEGAVVISVKKGSAASQAGITKGDIITKINKSKIKDTAYLRYELYQHQSGETINITYIRDGKEKTVKVKLSSSS